MSESKIIKYLLKFRPTAEWIIEHSKLPYLQIDLDVPINLIFDEWNKVKHLAVPHRETDNYGGLKNKGWKSLTIYGLDKHNTSSIGSNMHWTDVAFECPNTIEWIKSNFVVDSDTGRIRFMLLEPGGYIILHKDRSDNQLFEFNIAITNPEQCLFRFKDFGNVNFAPGICSMMNTSYEHFVVNLSNEPRLHIIVHSTLKNKNLIAQSYANRYYN